MIDAEQAFDIAKQRNDEFDKHTKFFDDVITEAANAGKTEVIIRKLPYGNWMFYPEHLSKNEKLIIALLKANGFKIKLFYEDGNQFSDWGMHISWEWYED